MFGRKYADSKSPTGGQRGLVPRQQRYVRKVEAHPSCLVMESSHDMYREQESLLQDLCYSNSYLEQAMLTAILRSVGNELVNTGKASASQVVAAIASAKTTLKAAGYDGPVATVDTMSKHTFLRLFLIFGSVVRSLGFP